MINISSTIITEFWSLKKLRYIGNKVGTIEYQNIVHVADTLVTSLGPSNISNIVLFYQVQFKVLAFGHVRFFIQLNHLAEAERVVRLDTKNITHSNGSVEWFSKIRLDGDGSVKWTETKQLDGDDSVEISKCRFCPWENSNITNLISFFFSS